MSKITIAVLQPSLPHEMKPAQRLEKQLGMCEQAVRAGADCIFFPEFFLGSSFVMSLNGSSAELEMLRAYARQKHVILGINAFTPAEEAGRAVYNSVMVIDAMGNLAQVYHKCRPYAGWEPTLVASAGHRLKLGEGPLVYKGEACTIGLAQCIDLWVGSFMKELSMLGAEIVYVPSRMPLPHFLSTTVFARVRAMENCNYVAVAGEAGRTAPGSFIAGPRLGGLEMDLTAAGVDEGIILKTVDLDWLRRQRSTRPPIFEIRSEAEMSAKARATETDWTNAWYEAEKLKEFMRALEQAGYAEPSDP
ncbi:MAG: carbon-nitrogen hydrolase family protein [Candidatus Bathyarchaeia archaeon]